MTVVVFGVLGAGRRVSSPGWATVKETFFNWRRRQGSRSRTSCDAFWINMKMFLIARSASSSSRCRRDGPGQPVAVADAAADPRHRLHRRGPRHPDHPAGAAARLRHAGAALAGPHQQRVLLGDGRARHLLQRVRRRGLPLRHRVGPPVAGGQRPGARPLRGQTLRHVVVPQAVRRVVPPLLNDFVSLQKDTALRRRRPASSRRSSSRATTATTTSTTRRTSWSPASSS